MRKDDALKLHNGDEVVVRKTGQILRVMERHLHPKVIYLLLSDGYWYNHKKLKTQIIRRFI